MSVFIELLPLILAVFKGSILRCRRWNRWAAESRYSRQDVCDSRAAGCGTITYSWLHWSHSSKRCGRESSSQAASFCGNFTNKNKCVKCSGCRSQILSAVSSLWRLAHRCEVLPQRCSFSIQGICCWRQHWLMCSSISLGCVSAELFHLVLRKDQNNNNVLAQTHLRRGFLFCGGFHGYWGGKWKSGFLQHFWILGVWKII